MNSGFFAADPSKAFFEKFSLIWAPTSMAALLVGLLGTGYYKQCGRDEYLAVSILLCLPGFVYPILFPSLHDRGKRYVDRFWVKAAVWLSIFSFYGNYFWTHYFYTVLGAEYLFDSYLFNDVPVVTYICTYFYFSFYFALVNIVLRRLERALHSIVKRPSRLARTFSSIAWALCIFLVAVGTALFEAVSIQHFPLYTYKDSKMFLTAGSVFYGMYFMVGFPMFFALDEYSQPATRGSANTRTVPAQLRGTHSAQERSPAEPRRDDWNRSVCSCGSGSPTSFWYVAQNALAAVAIVTLLLDLWRLVLGDIYSWKGEHSGVPFIARCGSAIEDMTTTSFG